MAKDKAKSKPKIVLPKFVLPELSSIMIWRLGFAAMALTCVSLASLLWMSGAPETKEAFKDGRRLLIQIDTGAILGKQTAAEEAKVHSAPAVSSAPVSAALASSAPAESSSGMSDSPASGASADDSSSATESSEQSSSAEAIASVADLPVTPVPDANPALVEKADIGPLPIIAEDGTTSWRYFGKAYERKGTLPMVAIVITGLGENKTVTDKALRLPENIGLSFSPYAHDLASWARAAHAYGHEVLIDLPLEPGNYPISDPGPYGLLSGNKKEDNDAHLKWLMSRFTGYAGFLTPQNEQFSSNNDAFRTLLQTLSTRGLMLLVGREPPKSETKQVIESGNTPAMVGDVLIDEDLSATAIQTRLNSLEQTAKTRGYAIGIAQAYPITIQQLNAWAAKLEEDGFVLVPVTFITHLRFS